MASEAEEEPAEFTVVFVQTEALGKEEEVRQTFESNRFVLMDQTVVKLSKHQAAALVAAAEAAVEAEAQAVASKVPSDAGDEENSGPDDELSSGSGSDDDGEDESKGAEAAEAAARVRAADQEAKVMSSGPMLVLLYGREKAVERAQQAVGSLEEAAEPPPPEAEESEEAEGKDGEAAAAEEEEEEEEAEEYDDSPDPPMELPKGSLRLRFGRDAVRCGVRCSASAAIARAQRRCLFADASGHQGPASGAGEIDRSRAATRRDWSDRPTRVSMASLLNFVFPARVQHPLSRGRLFLFALYGPLDRENRLHSGPRGEHIVTPRELDTMCRALVREDILSIYTKESGLSPEEEEVLLAQADSSMKQWAEYDKDDVLDIMRGLPEDEYGLISFHDMQKAISAERARHVARLKGNVDSALKRRNKSKRLVPPTLKYTQAKASMEKAQATLSRYSTRTAPQTMFDYNKGKTGEEVTDMINRALCTNSFKITHIEGGNDANLVENVRLLCQDRDDFVAEEGKEEWDNNVCNRKQERGTWVKSRNTPGYGLGKGHGPTKVTYTEIPKHTVRRGPLAWGES